MNTTTQKRILDYLKNYPKATRQEVAIALGDITEDGVKCNIGLLQQYGVLQRKGGRKVGEWVVLIIREITKQGKDCKKSCTFAGLKWKTTKKSIV